MKYISMALAIVLCLAIQAYAAEPVATVHGKPLYSDKQLAGVSGNRITFTDGSWIDVTTGAIHNNGKGYISFTAPEGESNLTTSVPKNYQANALRLDGLYEQVDIQPHDGPDITVTVSGTKEKVENVTAKVDGNTLVISSTNIREGVHIETMTIFNGNGDMSISGARGVVMSFVNGTSTVSINGHQYQTNIKVQIPVGTPIELAQSRGKVTIGETHSSLSGSIVAQSDVIARRITDVDVWLSAQGDLEIDHVSGRLQARLSAQGDLNVYGGMVSVADIILSAQGDADVQAVVNQANITCSAQGDVYFKEVTNTPRITESGQCSVRVGNWR